MPSHAFHLSKIVMSWIWVPPLSLVTTHRIANLLSFPHPTKIFQFGWCCLSYDIPCLQHGELPHSEIHGSLSTSYSPWRIAGSCVLHRLLVPRHPLCALISLTFIIFSNSTNFIYFSKIFLERLSLSKLNMILNCKLSFVEPFVQRVSLERRWSIPTFS